MADCEGEKTIHYEEDGWSVTLTRYVSMELGETVASWVEFPNGWYLHSDDADAEFTQDGAKTYLQRLKSVWMESPFWDSVKAMEEKRRFHPDGFQALRPGVLLGYRRCGAGIPMYVRVYPKRYGT